MTLGLITNNRRGSCSVHGHHESGESTHFANIEVNVRTKKRPRGQETPGFDEKSKCYLTVSVWKVLKSFSSHSLARSFSHMYTFRHHLKSWSDAKILAIHDVSQVSSFAYGTCFGLALYGRGNRYGTVIGIIRESETALLPIVVHDKEPVSAVILRGPTLLCLSAPGVATVGRDGVKCAVNWLDSVNVSDNITSICNVEDESYALACSTTSDDDSPCVLQISSIHWNGDAAVLFTVENQFESSATLRAASLDRRLLFFSTARGVLHAVDMVSQTSKWRTRMHSDIVKQLRMAILQNGLLILSTLSEAEDFYAVHITTSIDSSRCVGDIRKLFSVRCDQEKGTKHLHFCLPWQNLLLKVNYEEGNCCDEEDTHENRVSSVSSGNPSMFQIENHLGRRVEQGLDQFLEDKERIKDKMKMMKNVRALLAEELEHSEMKSTAPLFEGRVTCIASISNRKAQNVQNDCRSSEESVHELEQSDSASLDMNQIGRRINHLRVIESSCQLDRLRSSVTIETQFVLDEILRQGEERGSECVHAKLRLHSSDRISSVWSCNEISVSEKENHYRLWAASPLAVLTNSSNLPNTIFTATIDLSNGLSHPVGLFTLASLMCSTKTDDKPNQNITCGELSNSMYYISASGGSTDHLRGLLTQEDIARHTEFKIGEHSTRITLNLASQNELSTLLATLIMRSGDNITFQGTPEPCKRSLFDVDTALTLLENEKKEMKSISSHKNVFGYTAEEVMSVIERQIDVDDAFGLIEEQQIWL